MLRIKKYTNKKKIGEGNFGVVYSVVDAKTKSKTYTMKKVKDEHDQAKSEVKILQTLAQSDHLSSNFIIKLIEDYESKKKLYIILEYVKCKFQKILKKLKYQLEEKTIKFYVMQVMLALKYIHQYGVVHGDIKPENILIAPNGYLKLIDFGNGKTVSSLSKIPCKGFRGTVDYMAPEIITGTSYDEAVDWWALGVLVFEMLSGHTPFKKTNTLINIRYCMLYFPASISENLPLKDFINRLLIVDPKMRLANLRDDNSSIFDDNWLREKNDYLWDNVEEQREPVPREVQSIIRYYNLR